MEKKGIFIIVIVILGYLAFVLIFLFNDITQLEIFFFVIRFFVVLTAIFFISKVNTFSKNPLIMIFLTLSLVSVLVFFPFIHSFIHEIHHTLVAKIFGVNVLFIKAGYIWGKSTFNFSSLTDFQIALLALAGSLSTITFEFIIIYLICETPKKGNIFLIIVLLIILTCTGNEFIYWSDDVLIKKSDAYLFISSLNINPFLVQGIINVTFKFFLVGYIVLLRSKTKKWFFKEITNIPERNEIQSFIIVEAYKNKL